MEEDTTNTFPTIELLMPRNMARFFNGLAQTIENEGSFDPYRDMTTREFVFNAPLFLDYNQALLDDILMIYNAHYGLHQSDTAFLSSGRKTDILYKTIAAYPANLSTIIKHINFLDYYDAPLLLRGFTRYVRAIIYSRSREQSPPTPRPEFEPQSLIEKVFIKEASIRNHVISFIRGITANLNVFDTITRHLWPQLGPFVLCKKGFTIVATTEGLFGFGNNKNGVLGLGDLLLAETPTKIPLENVSSFACNDKYSVFITRDGLYECGLPVMRYREPMQGKNDVREPTKILIGIGPIISVACGKKHMLILGQNGTLYGYGFNDKGQLGLYKEGFGALLDFESGERGSYGKITGLSDIISFACGDYHSVVLTKEGLFGCGSNNHGQLGLGDRVDRHIWTKIPIEGVISFWCSPAQTMVLTKDGLFACGDNYYGQLGITDNRVINGIAALTRVPLEGVISVSMNDDVTLILTKDGLFGCGFSRSYNIETDNDNPIFVPVRLPIENVISMSCCETHYTVVTLDGLYVHGYNEINILGLGHTDELFGPTKLTSLRIGIEESPQLTRDLPPEIKIENEPEAKKRRIDSLLCTRCDNIATHVEPFQERIRFCSAACYKDFFTPKAKLTREY